LNQREPSAAEPQPKAELTTDPLRRRDSAASRTDATDKGNPSNPRNPRLKILAACEQLGLLQRTQRKTGGWAKGRDHLEGEDYLFPKFPSLRSLSSLRLANCSFQAEPKAPHGEKSAVDLQPLTAIQQNNFTPQPAPFPRPNNVNGVRNHLPINHFPPTLFSPNGSPIYERRNYFSQPAAKRVTGSSS
jgi:hypothetical protein